MRGPYKTKSFLSGPIDVGFLTALLLSGLLIHLIYGEGPQKLLVESGSDFNRVVITAMHMNETNW